MRSATVGALLAAPLLVGAVWLGGEWASSPPAPVLGASVVLAAAASADPTTPGEEPAPGEGAVTVPPAPPCSAGDDADDADDIPDPDDADEPGDVDDCD